MVRGMARRRKGSPSEDAFAQGAKMTGLDKADFVNRFQHEETMSMLRDVR